MTDVNNVNLGGVLVEMPYIKASNGWTLVKLRIACTVAIWRRNEETGQTERSEALNYFTVKAAGDEATAVAQLLRKDDRCWCVGRLRQETYIDQHGAKHTEMVIEATKVVRLDTAMQQS